MTKLFIVRNEQGQRLGSYRATSAKAAIQRLIDDQLATCATFRRSSSMPKGLDKLTAKVEG